MGVISAPVREGRWIAKRSSELWPGSSLVVTVEEGNAFEGGFGSAVPRTRQRQRSRHPAMSSARATRNQFLFPHGDRNELLAEIGLDVKGLMQARPRNIWAPFVVGG